MENHTQTSIQIWQGLMAAKDIVSTLKISRAYLHVLTAQGKFPPPAIKNGTRYTRWRASDVKAWLDDPNDWRRSLAPDAHKVSA